MRLIDADELLEGFKYTIDANGNAIRYRIKCAPTVDAEPVRHGKWIELVVAETDTGRLIHWSCSECAIVVDHNTDNYCPNCGARMDGE